MPDVADDLQIRVATLEAAIREVLLAAQPSAKLQKGVERLTDETAGLNALLTRVDEQQRRLSVVSKKVEEVDHDAMRRQEVEERICRERTMRRIITGIGLVGLLSVLGLVLYVSSSAHNACVNRQAATRAQIDVLQGFKTGGPGDALLEQGIDRLDDTLIKTCDEQYPLAIA